MRSIVFDTGPLISLTMTHLMWTLDHLKKRFDGNFYITEAVRKELIDRPLEINKFKFEALHSLRYLRKNVIEVYPKAEYEELSHHLLELTNNIFSAHHKPIQIVHRGEIETLALAIRLKAQAVAVDERTTLELVESADRVKYLLSKKLHTKIHVNYTKLEEFKELTKDLRPIRSVGFAMAAYEMGLLDRYLPDGPFDRGILLDAVLWSLKLNGCAITQTEIEELVKLEFSH